ncbi:hypothetical protein IFM89_011683 [Coptis chinensis]|uniref:Uncharacterized protein n=1 Tax=Coptis chinensis TaxID=261450 RepID=A0A835LRN3_9MAGN|nr:hypothetical protein IFM89_011683 [Coptis chinensis]
MRKGSNAECVYEEPGLMACGNNVNGSGRSLCQFRRTKYSCGLRAESFDLVVDFKSNVVAKGYSLRGARTGN